MLPRRRKSNGLKFGGKTRGLEVVLNPLTAEISVTIS